MKNEALIIGIVREFGYSHSTKNVELYKGIIEVERISGTIDRIPFQTWQNDIEINKYYDIKGKIGTHNRIEEDGTSHKETFIKVLNIIQVEQGFDNEVEFECFLVKKDNTRITPLGRHITDFIVAINDEKYNKTAYPSLIVWGWQTKIIKTAQIGDKFYVKGRFQSREYISGSTGKNGIAYEISCNDIKILDDVKEYDL